MVSTTKRRTSARPKRLTRLPRKMSALIRLALGDLRKVEKSKTYRVNMGTWHDEPYVGNAKCTVCFAGSVMAKSLAAKPTESAWPEKFGGLNAGALYALNSLRRGSVTDALEHLRPRAKVTDAVRDLNRDVPDYGQRARLRFHAAMRKLARDLEKAGL